MKFLFFLFVPWVLFSYTPVIMPNGKTLPYHLVEGVKEFHLVAEVVQQEFLPGMVVNVWGYNGSSPGPVIEAVEGDRVRILVTNHLPEPTTVHWHGLMIPNGMDGVSGLNQRAIAKNETAVYEFTLKQNGTFLYHPHYDDITQIGMGMSGFFIIHPKEEENVDRDFVIMLAEWAIPPGGSTPNPMSMESNYFTFNSAIYPKVESLVAKLGDKVRIRFGNLSLSSHPIHLHGYEFKVTRAGGNTLPLQAQWSEVTVDVPVGSTRDIEFVANNPGDWAMHCHITHHSGMPGMGHGQPNFMGVNQEDLLSRMQKLIPGYMAMEEKGMGDMFSKSQRMMPHPPNFVPWGNPAPHGTMELSSMFTIFKVREGLTSYNDPGWYQQPKNTQVQFFKN